jgi:hypothetical protein
MEFNLSFLPRATCTECGRVVECVRVQDGTIYKPTAWTYPNPDEPLRGVCGGCQRASAVFKPEFLTEFECARCKAKGIIMYTAPSASGFACAGCFAPLMDEQRAALVEKLAKAMIESDSVVQVDASARAVRRHNDGGGENER